jgi:hypothetical protein
MPDIRDDMDLAAVPGFDLCVNGPRSEIERLLHLVQRRDGGAVNLTIDVTGVEQVRASVESLLHENRSLRDALDRIADEGCATPSFADCCDKDCRRIAREALAAPLTTPSDMPTARRALAKLIELYDEFEGNDDFAACVAEHIEHWRKLVTP